ncbi:MAG: ABC transporter permease [Bacilli bacterium]|nr:ABC transporter permease [Bacilli bacterium]
MKMKQKHSIEKYLFTVPVIIYSFLLILLPLLYVLLISFFKSDSYGGMIYTFTLSNYAEIFNITYIRIFLKSIGIALITTVICLFIAYPFAISLMSKKETTRNLLIKLVMVPFLMNSLIRTYGWIVLLRKNGIINSALIGTGIINSPLSLMYNNLGIIIGMVYTLLPFMILPVYSAVSKVDPNLVEASYDLGASKIKTFTKIYLPLTISGAFNGSLMVFIPAIGYFFITDILGGGKIMIIGNLIKNQFLTARNWPFGAAISIFLILMTLILVKIYKQLGGKMDDLGGM